MGSAAAEGSGSAGAGVEYLRSTAELTGGLAVGRGWMGEQVQRHVVEVVTGSGGEWLSPCPLSDVVQSACRRSAKRTSSNPPAHTLDTTHRRGGDRGTQGDT